MDMGYTTLPLLIHNTYKSDLQLPAFELHFYLGLTLVAFLLGLLSAVLPTMYDIDTDELKSAYEAKKASSGVSYDETWQAAVDAAKAAQA